MKILLLAALFAATASSTIAGERFSGSHSYTGTAKPWYPAPGAGYSQITMIGDYVPDTGPIPKSRVECRGNNFWSPDVSEANGVCVFGELPDRWMLRYRMTDREPREQRRERFGRRGEWTVVAGVGRFEGMTGSGTYLAESGLGENGTYRTMWEGEVTILD